MTKLLKGTRLIVRYDDFCTDDHHTTGLYLVTQDIELSYHMTPRMLMDTGSLVPVSAVQVSFQMTLAPDYQPTGEWNIGHFEPTRKTNDE